ncbi:MAG TPA: 3-hydroxyacyl-ACP dehydratase FabZ [Candidatus Mcinerneyibacteriales bacterium]|nr:3-hydroxyacyl-ACP dehydratase FabZ [Candidatus Mcinerneyibacteriales bacterium]
MAVMDTKKIMEILPHRFPFLLIDTIEEIDENHCVAKKNVTVNEPMFTGHFPENPIFPGVLIIEAMAQTGGVLLAERTGFDKEKQNTLFMGMDSVKFRKPVFPGDTMMIKVRVEQSKKLKNGYFVKLKGEALVDGEVRASGLVTAGIFDKEEA